MPSCPNCGGTGDVDCDRCSYGKVDKYDENDEIVGEKDCPECGGTGYKTCPTCHGGGGHDEDYWVEDSGNVPEPPYDKG
jgi:hypothetical protein